MGSSKPILPNKRYLFDTILLEKTLLLKQTELEYFQKAVQFLFVYRIKWIISKSNISAKYSAISLL